MNKKDLLPLVISELENQLSQAITAATNAHNAAIDDQSKAETQYDTLAIEAAYLAEGQSRRIETLKSQITLLSQLTLHPSDNIELGALVSVEYDDGEIKHFLILPSGAGIQVFSKNKTIYVITPSAPICQALLGKSIDDDFLLTNTGTNQSGYVTAII
ncbi:hypothetical protein HII17_09785 [Thalassotalea sp. M1531]|uniref:Transcription elongation factor GreAB n=1 Tax=Thalassotalea algicola TaxID=2716224 RepID=A0A7Y0LES9_9GAMM|nr:GreA/GreB family elongation factor [Thalassotalea algicola]NMP31855.1 hypothetical protein [Thalassotalea algicola]